MGGADNVDGGGADGGVVHGVETEATDETGQNEVKPYKKQRQQKQPSNCS